MDRLRRRQGEQPLRLRHREERRVRLDQVGDERPLRFRRAGPGVDRRLEFVRPVGDPLRLGEARQVLAPAGGLPGVAAARQQVPQVEVRLRRQGRHHRRRAQLGEGPVALPDGGERQTDGHAGARFLLPRFGALEQRRASDFRYRQRQRRPQHFRRLRAPPGLVEQEPQPESRPPVFRLPGQRLPVRRLRRPVLAQVVEHIAAAEVGLGALRGSLDSAGAGGLRVLQPFLPGAQQADLQERPRVSRSERQRRVEPPSGLGVTREARVERPEVVLRLEGAGIARRRPGQRRKAVRAPADLHIEHPERRQHLRPPRVLGTQSLETGDRLLAPSLRGEHDG